ncbi:MAG: mercury methylation corrinoid protein HgcA [Coriobacteriia bacterium]|nr:mercury methylation corrinoid protein HgcA [Coriobacteriia bacterium]
MSECCGPSQPCCGGTPALEYEYGPEPYVDGTVDTFAGPVKRVTTELSSEDRLGALRVRLAIARNDYRVRPALYAIGAPDDTSPVLVTGNYKLTFDTLRGELGGRDVWLLVIDSRGVNVWCAAGKGVFSTAEVVRGIRDARLEQTVSHTRVVLPQLGATGVAAHEVRAATGFSAVWGPVRAGDLPAFLDAGMKATPAMRRVHFELKDRARLVGVEASVLWSRRSVIAIGVLVAAAFILPRLTSLSGEIWLLTMAVGVLAVLAGAVVMPLLLPWLPGRTFALKGAIAGALLLAVLLAVTVGAPLELWAWGLLSVGTALASFVGMNFTGSSTYTSPSGVEWEMRRAIPLQIAAASVGFALFVVSLVMGQVG